MTAPTEEEIRAAIAREWPSIEVGFSDGIGDCQRLLDGLFDTEDLRPSEQQRLDDLTFAAVDPIRNEARRQINEAMVAAALAFAAECPDAPRAIESRLELRGLVRQEVDRRLDQPETQERLRAAGYELRPRLSIVPRGTSAAEPRP